MTAPLLKPIRWSSLDSAGQQQALRRPALEQAGLEQAVAGILQQVRQGGDAVLRQLTQQFDNCSPVKFEYTADDLQAACQRTNSDLRAAISDASDRIRRFHAADMPQDRSVETAPGLTCSVRYRPLSAVGLYIPGGSAPLISTVMMLAIPAKLAGCAQVVMCTPPATDGSIPDEVLAAASLCGVDRVFCVGGAQAVAAMAYGTETVPRCYKIFGPGNAWVTEAKQQVSRDASGAAIDMPAGPSEVLVIADETALRAGHAEFIAWDLLSQAEHGPDSQVLLLTDCAALADAVISQVERLVPTSPRADILRRSLAAARIILLDDLDTALALSNEYAPEHLILNTADARGLASRAENAGSVFIGPWTPESLGDYCSGTNHVLPTYGWARSHGALGVGDFMRRMTLQEASAAALAQVGPVAATLAEAEGLHAHQMAVVARLNPLNSTADKPA